MSLKMESIIFFAVVGQLTNQFISRLLMTLSPGRINIMFL